MGSIEHDNQFGSCGACGSVTTIEDGCKDPMCGSELTEDEELDLILKQRRKRRVEG